MTPITQMRLTDSDKKRIRYINKHTEFKTATAAVQVALQAYADAVRNRVGGDK